MNTMTGLPPGALEFALPHAVNLAEAGSSIDERKTGVSYWCLHRPYSLQLPQDTCSALKLCLRVMT
jgi:hypothetical protein